MIDFIGGRFFTFSTIALLYKETQSSGFILHHFPSVPHILPRLHSLLALGSGVDECVHVYKL
jgi:hypothetical protein